MSVTRPSRTSPRAKILPIRRQTPPCGWYNRYRSSDRFRRQGGVPGWRSRPSTRVRASPITERRGFSRTRQRRSHARFGKSSGLVDRPGLGRGARAHRQGDPDPHALDGCHSEERGRVRQERAGFGATAGEAQVAHLRVAAHHDSVGALLADRPRRCRQSGHRRSDGQYRHDLGCTRQGRVVRLREAARRHVFLRRKL